jgi:hypothetical protein
MKLHLGNRWQLHQSKRGMKRLGWMREGMEALGRRRSFEGGLQASNVATIKVWATHKRSILLKIPFAT